MTISFRPAVRENVGLLIGLAGASGSGKTFSAMRLASGMAGDKRFAVLDTENGRASHYADQFAFDVAELHAPFTPARYAEAIKAADDAGYSVIVVDSMSHEHAGDGGILDMQDEEFERLGRRDAVKVLSWAKPKSEHKKMMQRLLQTKAHLILCFRAEAKIDLIKEDGKTKIVPKQSLIGLDGWIPITEKTVPFELTVSVLLVPDKPGIPQPIKVQQQHRPMLPPDHPITEETGRRLAEWARGQKTEPTPAGQQQATGGERITARQAADLEVECIDGSVPVKNLCAAAGVRALDEIKVAELMRARKWLETAIEKRKPTTEPQQPATTN